VGLDRHQNIHDLSIPLFPSYLDYSQCREKGFDMLKGIHFVVDDRGEKKAVQIDLEKYGDIWEDFYDTIVAKERSEEPRETLEEVRQKLIEH
jgi:hypothetical protein